MPHDVPFMSTLLHSAQWVKLMRANQLLQVLRAMRCRLELNRVVLSNLFRFTA
jgi:hypothetical protein